MTVVALLLAGAGCQTAQSEKVSYYQMGTVQSSAAVFRCEGQWYLESCKTEKGLPAARLNSVLTDQTAAMAAVESDCEIVDAIYRNGIFYIATTQSSEDGSAIDYTVYKSSNAGSELILQGVCGNDLSQSPAFAHLKDGTVLVVQDQDSGLGLYLIPENASESIREISAEDAALISVTPKIYQNRMALFAESQTGTCLLTYDMDFSAGNASLVADIPLEQGAKMVDYTLSGEELLVCQQTADTTGAGPAYELCVYQLDTGELVQQEALEEQPVYPVCGLQSGGFLCQDDAGTLFVTTADDLGTRQVLDQMGAGPFKAYGNGGAYFLVNAEGEVYAVDAQAPAQTASPTPAPELSYAPDRTAEIQYVDEGGIQALTAYNNDLLPEYQAEMIYAVFEPETDRFRFQLAYLQDGRRYFLESSFRWSDQSLLAYSVNAYQQGPDAALPVAVLQPLTEQHLLTIAQILYNDLSTH